MKLSNLSSWDFLKSPAGPKFLISTSANLFETRWRAVVKRKRAHKSNRKVRVISIKNLVKTMDEFEKILESKDVDDDTKLRKELKKKDYTKESLVNYIISLRSRVEELESYSILTKRVEMLERSYMNHVQYNRRESIEIDGIPTSVCDEDLENTTILAEIGVPDIQPWQVHACHRLKNKNAL